MQWDGSDNAGFTTSTPWLPVSPDYEERNVAALAADPRSILSLYRQLITLRRQHPALQSGRYTLVSTAENVLAFERSDGETRLLIALNFNQQRCRVKLPAYADQALVLLSTCLDREDEHVRTEFELRGSEGVILQPTMSGGRRP